MNKPAQHSRGPGRPKNPLEKKTLLKIARQIFAKKGYDATSMMSIAEAAGISKASVFHHYPSKEELYLSALSVVIEEMSALINDAMLVTVDALASLDRLTDAVVDYFATHPPAAKLLLYELLSSGPFMRAGGTQSVQRMMEQSVSLISLLTSDDQDRATEKAMSIFGMHLLYFAASDITSRFKGRDIFSQDEVEHRKVALRQQMRQIIMN
jgi:AcrR family transcriptional regulator